MKSGRECALHSSYLPTEDLQEYLKTTRKGTTVKFANTNCDKLVILKSNYVQVSSPVGGEAKPIYLMVWDTLMPSGGLVVSVQK